MKKQDEEWKIWKFRTKGKDTESLQRIMRREIGNYGSEAAWLRKIVLAHLRKGGEGVAGDGEGEPDAGGG